MSISYAQPSQMHTPWGHADSLDVICPGVTRVHTPSHGGYGVLPEVVAKWPKPLREFEPFAGRGWYEEDCDWSVVVAAMPSHFGSAMKAAAVKMMKGHLIKHVAIRDWLESDEAKPTLTLVDDWLASMAREGRYEAGGGGGHGRGWNQNWTPFDRSLPTLVTWSADYPDTSLMPTRAEMTALFGSAHVKEFPARAVQHDGTAIMPRYGASMCERAYHAGWRPGALDRSFDSPANRESARAFLAKIPAGGVDGVDAPLRA